MSTQSAVKSVTAPWILSQKGQRKLTMLTAYDYPTAVLLDECGIDILLIGDSVGTVIYGERNTLSVTLDDIIRHTKAVSRGARRALVAADLPFLTYQVSVEQALQSAGRLLKEAGAQAVKLEGGSEMAITVKSLTRAGIPVIGHIGLTPQSINTLGSYRMHGKTQEERSYLLESARDLWSAGAFALVLECVEAGLAEEITSTVGIPTFGIGSSAHCDGQVLVTQDLVGLTSGHVPKFVKPLANLNEPFRDAISAFIHRTQNPRTQNPEVPASLRNEDAKYPQNMATGA